MRKTYIHFLFVFILLLAPAILLPPAPAAAAAKKVAIVPFKVNAEKDMGYLRDGVYDMLGSRLSKEGEVEVLNRQVVEKALPAEGGSLAEPSARELGRKLGADFVLFGSLTVLGNGISLDSKMVDVGGGKPTLSFFEQSEDAGGIITRLNAMSADINAKMFGRAATAAPAAAPAQAPTAAADTSQAHPEKMFKQQGGMGAEGAGSPFVTEEGGREISPQFWKSTGFKLLFNGLALGDVDGDGKPETVIVTPHSVLIFRYDQQRFAQVFEFPEDRPSVSHRRRRRRHQRQRHPGDLRHQHGADEEVLELLRPGVRRQGLQEDRR